MKTVSILLLMALLSSAFLSSISFSIAMSKRSSDEASATVTPWPTFHHDNLRSGYSLSTAPNTNKTTWKVPYGGARFSSPAIAYGRIFLGYGATLVVLNETTGDFMWDYPFRYEVLSSPAVADNRVFIAARSWDGEVLVCLDLDGNFVWSFRMSSDGYAWSSPAVADGMVFVGSGRGPGFVYSLDAATGNLIWKYPAYRVYAAVSVSNGRVFAVDGNGFVLSLNQSTGDLIWKNGTGAASSPVIVNGRVFVGGGEWDYGVNSLVGWVYCFNETTGNVLWKSAIGDSVIGSTPAVHDGRVFIGLYSNEKRGFWSLNETSGEELWHYFTIGGVANSLAVADGKVYGGTSDGYVYCLSEETGAVVWKYKTGNISASSPAIADGSLYISSMDGYLYCFGEPQVTIPTELQFDIEPNPVMVGQTVCVTGNVTTDDNSPIHNAQVIVKSNGTHVAALTTNSTGWFRACRRVESAGTFNITIQYDGSTLYLPSSDWEILIVNKAETRIYSIFVPNPVNSGETCMLEGVLLGQFSNPIRFAIVSLEYSIDYGSTWHPAGTLTTDSYGIFSYTFTAPSPGTYLVKISYAGSPNYESSATDILLIVR